MEREDRALVSIVPLEPDNLGSNPSCATYELCVVGQFPDLWELQLLTCKRRMGPPHRLNELRI